MPPLNDPTDTITPGRVLEALENATREMTEIRGRVEVSERALAELEESIEERMGRLETQMTSMNAHLDNIAREAHRTNDLLETNLQERQSARGKKERAEREVRQRQQEIEDDNREATKRVAKELWEVFKQPLGFLVAGVIAWLVYNYFAVPKGSVVIPVPEAEVSAPAEIP